MQVGTLSIFIEQLHLLSAQWSRIHLSIEEKQEIHVWSLVWEDPLEKEMATPSSIIAWKIPWTEESGRLQSMGLERVGHTEWAHMQIFTIYLPVFFLHFSFGWFLFILVWNSSYIININTFAVTYFARIFFYFSCSWLLLSLSSVYLSLYRRILICMLSDVSDLFFIVIGFYVWRFTLYSFKSRWQEIKRFQSKCF